MDVPRAAVGPAGLDAVRMIERFRLLLAALVGQRGADTPPYEKRCLVFQCHGEEALDVARRVRVFGIAVAVEETLLPTPPGIGALGVISSVFVSADRAAEAREVIDRRGPDRLGGPRRDGY